MSSNLSFQPIVINMGCRLNAYESSVISSIMKALNMEEFVAINTCTITNESEKQCRQEIRKLKKQFPDKKILVTGCASQLHKEYFINMEEVDFVIGNSMKNNKSAYNEIVKFNLNQSFFKSKKELQEHLICENSSLENEIDQSFNDIYEFDQKSRAFLGIQSGCNHYCSFCIVPFTRGKMKSVKIENVIESVNGFIKNGYNEVVLTGVDITDYGSDLYGKRSLGKLCKDILIKTTLKRLRLSSVDVSEIDHELIEAFHDKRFMPYFHISLQSGSNSVLKRMRRRHRKEDLLSFKEKILNIKSETLFGADIITGFNNETEEEFLESIFIAKFMPITFMHAFSYSKKEKTLGEKMLDDISLIEKKRRTNLLISIGEDNLLEAAKKMINKTFDCILEHGGFAKTENFMTIKLLNENNKFKPKDLIKVHASKIENKEIFGEILDA